MTVHRQKTTVQKFFGYRQQKYASMNVNENSEGDGNMLYRIACCDDEQQILDRLNIMAQLSRQKSEIFIMN